MLRVPGAALDAAACAAYEVEEAEACSAIEPHHTCCAARAAAPLCRSSASDGRSKSRTQPSIPLVAIRRSSPPAAEGIHAAEVSEALDEPLGEALMLYSGLTVELCEKIRIVPS